MSALSRTGASGQVAEFGSYWHAGSWLLNKLGQRSGISLMNTQDSLNITSRLLHEFDVYRHWFLGGCDVGLCSRRRPNFRIYEQSDSVHINSVWVTIILRPTYILSTFKWKCIFKKCKWYVERLNSLVKSGSAHGTTIYISVHRWSKYDKVPFLKSTEYQMKMPNSK